MNINIDLSQKQLTTQYMIQYMNLLQMNHTELEGFLEKKSLENPTIEFEKNAYWCNCEYHDRSGRTTSDTDTEWTSNAWEDKRESEDRLSDYIISQLSAETFSRTEASILRYLACSLDHRGYFSEDPAIAAHLFSVDTEHILDLLRVIQSLAPNGIGARNLSECLLIQLEHMDIKDNVLETVILYHLEELSRNHLDKIAAELNVPISRIQEAAETIKMLNPKPGSYFSNRDYVAFIIPDIYVERDNFNLKISLPEHQRFKFSINHYYQHLKNTTEDLSTRTYLQHKIQQAEWISDSLRQRSDTIIRVVQKIAEIQRDFFIFGPGYKRPMKLTDLAKELDMHPSTISRTLRSKYLHCEWGVFSLNYFLTTVAATTRDTADEKTPDQIKKQIRRIVDQENKAKPLSDQKICTMLEACAIYISRRTVNKYRSEMNIPDKIGRKIWV